MKKYVKNNMEKQNNVAKRYFMKNKWKKTEMKNKRERELNEKYKREKMRERKE